MKNIKTLTNVDDTDYTRDKRSLAEVKSMSRPIKINKYSSESSIEFKLDVVTSDIYMIEFTTIHSYLYIESLVTYAVGLLIDLCDKREQKSNHRFK